MMPRISGAVGTSEGTLKANGPKPWHHESKNVSVTHPVIRYSPYKEGETQTQIKSLLSQDFWSCLLSAIMVS